MLQIPAPPPPPIPPEISTVVVGHGGPNIAAAVVVLVAMVVAAAMVVLLPLARAYARRLEGGSAGDAAQLRGELDELRARLAEVEGEQQRFAELEERLDFAERLLTQQREQPAQLGRLPEAR